MYPKILYEALPWLYALAAWLSFKALSWPYALIPAGAFALATVLVIIQRWYYRRQLDDGES
ncbi:MAG TPA: hypothetical protein VMV40_08150 [Acidiferrobacter sp.]|nr:hypothetical protein [Acidiferrobacter sp.]